MVGVAVAGNLLAKHCKCKQQRDNELIGKIEKIKTNFNYLGGSGGAGTCNGGGAIGGGGIFGNTGWPIGGPGICPALKLEE